MFEEIADNGCAQEGSGFESAIDIFNNTAKQPEEEENGDEDVIPDQHLSHFNKILAFCSCDVPCNRRDRKQAEI